MTPAAVVLLLGPRVPPTPCRPSRTLAAGRFARPVRASPRPTAAPRSFRWAARRSRRSARPARGSARRARRRRERRQRLDAGRLQRRRRVWLPYNLLARRRIPINAADEHRLVRARVARPSAPSLRRRALIAEPTGKATFRVSSFREERRPARGPPNLRRPSISRRGGRVREEPATSARRRRAPRGDRGPPSSAAPTSTRARRSATRIAAQRHAARAGVVAHHARSPASSSAAPRRATKRSGALRRRSAGCRSHGEGRDRLSFGKLCDAVHSFAPPSVRTVLARGGVGGDEERFARRSQALASALSLAGACAHARRIEASAPIGLIGGAHDGVARDLLVVVALIATSRLAAALGSPSSRGVGVLDLAP